MRQTVDQQQKLLPTPDNHQHARELREISKILDANPEIYKLVHDDLVADVANPGTGRKGMTAEQVIRALIIYQMNGFSYEELEFHIADSICYREFCRIGYDSPSPKKKTLQGNIKKIRPETLESINKLIIGEAKKRKVEKGRKVRTDCTVEETNIHEPSDSTLLFDVVRVLDRFLNQAKEAGFEVEYTDHTTRAKRRMLDIQYSKKSSEREKAYRDLVKITDETMTDAVRAIIVLDSNSILTSMEAYLISIDIIMKLEHYVALGRKVILQTKRRVFWNERVPVGEKIVSIFEPHTDIIKKEKRETLFGHKLCLTTGVSGLILDCMILEGNPADASLAVEAIKRQVEIFGRAPRQASFDGGFASKDNLREIKEKGVKDVMFHKKRGLKITDMVKSSWVYKRLKRFRAGIEGVISFLKRCFGLSRCPWCGFDSFKSYTLSGVISANLLVLARHALA